ncbi:hypothetical protein PUNSTDRAFT_136395 [Punctularia strigosozonata HHB-11173 SS5]|uniref:uncharacterized protein n=1 Tax=Punctularia strigosozonata (strain HHB-11173) TaxID=741275 RepID=UPI0004417EA0|nr:uncharacterized protein PUNSTDRAFT_136395 [Punctularia strigosozonata HHB-11173 SS5]EIN06540.1 hypothetical protein PUNSTDRAFT_136395 [Punctularia strigosozonata HHB-11173 SS5]
MEEIFGHLQPLDVLHLSWTSKDFHSLLMRRSSVFIWRAAFANVPDLPDLPPDMTEPQYARLAFAPLCSFCNSPGVRKIEWRLRCRACPRCVKSELEERYDYEGIFIPSRQTKYYYRYIFIKSVREEFCRQVSEMDDAAAEVFKKQARDRVNAINAHAKLCEQWSESRNRDRAVVLAGIRDQRYEEVVRRLTEMGWGEDIEKMRPPDLLRHHQLVRISKKLTEGGWKNICASLVEVMEGVKRERLVRDLEALRDARRLTAGVALNRWKINLLKQEGHLPLLPDVADFVHCPEVKAIIDSPDTNTITPESFDAAFDAVPNFATRWRVDADTMLARKVRKQMRLASPTDFNDDTKPDPDVLDAMLNRLKLAKTVFICSKCEPLSMSWADYGTWSDSDDGYDFVHTFPIKPLFYPSVFAHECSRRFKRIKFMKSTGVAEYLWTDNIPERSTDFVSDQACRQRWSPGCLSLHDEAERAMEQLLKSCGLNPDTTTAKEMEQLDYRFSCGFCHKVMPWRTTIGHHRIHDNRDIAWTRLGEEDAQRARNLEKNVESTLEKWQCVHCIDLPSEVGPKTIDDLKKHVEDCHNIHEPLVNQDYFQALEQPQPNAVQLC